MHRLMYKQEKRLQERPSPAEAKPLECVLRVRPKCQDNVSQCHAIQLRHSADCTLGIATCTGRICSCPTLTRGMGTLDKFPFFSITQPSNHYAVLCTGRHQTFSQISGWLFGFSFFVNSNPVAVFLLFEFYGIAMAATAFLLSRLIPTARAAQTIGFGAVLAGFVFQGILCGDYGLSAPKLPAAK